MKPASQSGPKRPFMADLLPLAYAADNETLPEIGFVDFQSLADVVVSELVSGDALADTVGGCRGLWR